MVGEDGGEGVPPSPRIRRSIAASSASSTSSIVRGYRGGIPVGTEGEGGLALDWCRGLPRGFGRRVARCDAARHRNARR